MNPIKSKHFEISEANGEELADFIKGVLLLRNDEGEMLGVIDTTNGVSIDFDSYTNLDALALREIADLMDKLAVVREKEV